jgi:hypothetical protein
MRFLDPAQPPEPPDLSKPAILYWRRSREDKGTQAESRAYQPAFCYAIARRYFLAREVTIYTDTDERN